MHLLAAVTASLTITVSPNGEGGDSYTRVVRCPGSPVCARLARIDNPFKPVPPDSACTQIYGGPDVAFVRGTYMGRRVWARFKRNDGCQIARWDRIAFLFR
jgi:hypothetical protein